MGHLDEKTFEATVNAGCPACHATTLDIRSFIDRRLQIMLAEPNNAGKWAHDGEKFIDGTYSITCASCKHVVFSSDICPRCNTAGGLARAVADTTRLVIPKRCPSCKETELLALALIPATAKYSPGVPPKPLPAADFGEPGYHVVVYACESCDAATVAQACPLCDAPGPLRPRP
jgi:hypothetical protein